MDCIYLRAASEADLIAVLPMLREDNQWIDSSPHHAFDPIPAMLLERPVYDDDGETILTPAVISDQWHANLLLADDHPQREAILAAIVPFVVTPSHPRRVFS